MTSANPGFAKGYYKGNAFLYRVVCLGHVLCGWTGYRMFLSRLLPCPRCGNSVRLA